MCENTFLLEYTIPRGFKTERLTKITNSIPNLTNNLFGTPLRGPAVRKRGQWPPAAANYLTLNTDISEHCSYTETLSHILIIPHQYIKENPTKSGFLFLLFILSQLLHSTSTDIPRTLTLLHIQILPSTSTATRQYHCHQHTTSHAINTPSIQCQKQEVQQLPHIQRRPISGTDQQLNDEQRETTQDPIRPTTRFRSATEYRYYTNTLIPLQTRTTGESLGKLRRFQHISAQLPQNSSTTTISSLARHTERTDNISILSTFHQNIFGYATVESTKGLWLNWTEKYVNVTNSKKTTTTMSQSNPTKLPPKSHYPAIVSGQLRYSTEDAARSLEAAPGFIYRIQLDLKAPNGTTFGEVPWTMTARRFFAALQSTDPRAIIVTRRKDSTSNNLSSHEEIPENPTSFEKDFVYDTQLSKNRVKFKIIIATTNNFTKTFKSGQMYQKLIQNHWFATMIRLQTQGLTVAIGHLCGAHNRFANHDDLILEINQLLQPSQCMDIDIIVTKPMRTYGEKNNNGTSKKQKIHTRWPTIFCPVDVANDLTTLLMEKWPELVAKPEYKNLNIRNMTLIPAGKNIIPNSTFIKYMANQNEFLHSHKEVVALYNCTNMDKGFTCTPDLAQRINSQHLSETTITLRHLLLSWSDLTTQQPTPIVRSIDRSYDKGSYTILCHNKYSKDVRSDVESLVSVLSSNILFASMTVGGTSGTWRGNGNFTSKSRSYAISLGNYDDQFGQLPTKTAPSDTVATESSSFTSPPVRSTKRTTSNVTCPATIDLTNPKTTLFRDVLRSSTSPNISQTSSLTTSRSSSNGTSTTALSTDKRQNTFQSGGLVTFKQYIASDEFRDCLSSIVAPQVSSLIQPTLSQITTIENDVKDLHSFITTQQQVHDSRQRAQEVTQQELTALRGDVSTILSLLSSQNNNTTNTGSSHPTTRTPHKINEYEKTSKQQRTTSPESSFLTPTSTQHSNTSISTNTQYDKRKTPTSTTTSKLGRLPVDKYPATTSLTQEDVTMQPMDQPRTFSQGGGEDP